ncbi:MAG TPA: RDD family protein [Pedobacter sp.]|nr:RDD family protein [Pedobacter sp.]
METIKVNTSQHIAIDYPVAGLGERIVARLIDLAVFFVLYILFIVLGLLSFAADASIVISIILGVYAGAYVFYNLICEIFMNGQSIGKRLMKIRVISLDGNQASLGQYFIRWLFRLVDFVLTAQVGGLICIAVSEKKQRIGDIVAGTVMIRTAQQTSYDHIAFHQLQSIDYVPVFADVHQLGDRDIELVHEVLATYYKTYNPDLVAAMASKIISMLRVNKPEGMNDLKFLETVIKDYNYITAQA